MQIEIYMDQPKEFIYTGKKHLMCKFKKTLYELKQSRRAWYHCIGSFFINKGFCKSQANHSLYAKQTNEYLMVTIL